MRVLLIHKHGEAAKEGRAVSRDIEVLLVVTSLGSLDGVTELYNLNFDVNGVQ
jgi:hypothetical protein